MDAALRAFAQLLARERQAARHADVDALLQLQAEKRALWPSLSALPREAITTLSTQAQANLVLLRHLALCLRACAAPEPAATYTSHGEAQRSAGLRLSGVL